MSGLADYTPAPSLRTVAAAGKCQFLGANLTEQEVKQYQMELLSGGIPCKLCNGQIPAYHCNHPEQGPFTRIAGKCTSCPAFLAVSNLGLKPVAGVADVASAVT